MFALWPWRNRPELPPVSGLGIAALYWAISQIGKGEEDGNNIGRDLDEFRRIANLRWSTGPWCAVFTTAAFVMGAKDLGIQLPWKPTPGAKRTHDRMIAAGAIEVPIADAKAGDLLTLHRGPKGSRKGHSALITQRLAAGVVKTVEGNVGLFPARVRRFEHDLARDRVYGVARL